MFHHMRLHIQNVRLNLQLLVVRQIVDLLGIRSCFHCRHVSTGSGFVDVGGNRQHDCRRHCDAHQDRARNGGSGARAVGDGRGGRSRFDGDNIASQSSSPQPQQLVLPFYDSPQPPCVFKRQCFKALLQLPPLSCLTIAAPLNSGLTVTQTRPRGKSPTNLTGSSQLAHEWPLGPKA
jgi:hypothetical protein